MKLILQIRFVWISDRMTSAGSMTNGPFANRSGHSMISPHNSGSRKKVFCKSAGKFQNARQQDYLKFRTTALSLLKMMSVAGTVRYSWKTRSGKFRDSGDTYTGLRVPPALHLSKVRTASRNYAEAVLIQYRTTQCDRFCVQHLAVAARQQIRRQ